MGQVADLNVSLEQIAKEFKTFSANQSHNFAFELISQLKELNKNLTEIKELLKPKESTSEKIGE